MAMLPNFVKVLGADGGGNIVTIINEGIYARPWGLNWWSIRCLDGTKSPVFLVNAGLYGRSWIPEPFTTTGIQNPEIWGEFGFGPGYVNEPYLVGWYIENIQQPVTFTLDSGELPPGLTLVNVGMTAQGQIDGIPEEAGLFEFVLRAVGPTANALKPFSIEIFDITPEEGSAFIYGN